VLGPDLQQLVEVGLDLSLGQRPLEHRDELAGHHAVHGRDALHLQGGRDLRVGVDVDLGEQPGATPGGCQPLQDGAELLARTTPGGPQVEHDGDLLGALEHVGLEAGVGDLEDEGAP